MNYTSPNVTADHYPDEPQLRKVSPAARKQMGFPPEAEPLSPHFRRRLLATIRDDDNLRDELAKLIRGTR